MASLCTVIKIKHSSYSKWSFVIKNKTEQHSNDEKYHQTGITVIIHTVRASAITLRSTAASSSWRSLVIAVKQASGTTSAALRVKKLELALISFPMYWVEGHISHCSQVSRRCHPEWSLCFGEFGWSSVIKHPPWTAFLLVMGKKLACFLWVTILPSFN